MDVFILSLKKFKIYGSMNVIVGVFLIFLLVLGKSFKVKLVVFIMLILNWIVCSSC